MLDWPDWLREAAECEAANYVRDTFSRLEVLLAAANVGLRELEYDPATGEIGFWGGHAKVADYDGKVTVALRAALLQAASQQEARLAELAADDRERDQTLEGSLEWKVPPPQLHGP